MVFRIVRVESIRDDNKDDGYQHIAGQVLAIKTSGG